MYSEPYWFEHVPERERFWTVTQIGTPQSSARAEVETPPVESVFTEGAEEVERAMQRGFEVGFYPGAFEPELISVNPDRYALNLYTSRHAAQEELRAIEERDPEEYLRLVSEHGQEQVDRAYSNSAPYEAVWTTPTLLLEQLKEIELAGLEGYGPPFETVRVDGRTLDILSFVRELERRVYGEEG